MQKASRQQKAIAPVPGSVRAWAYQVVALATKVPVLNMQLAGTNPNETTVNLSNRQALRWEALKWIHANTASRVLHTPRALETHT